MSMKNRSWNSGCQIAVHGCSTPHHGASEELLVFRQIVATRPWSGRCISTASVALIDEQRHRTREASDMKRDPIRMVGWCVFGVGAVVLLLTKPVADTRYQTSLIM